MRQTDNRSPPGRHRRGRTSGLGGRKHRPQPPGSVGLGQPAGASAPEAQWMLQPPGAGRSCVRAGDQ